MTIYRRDKSGASRGYATSLTNDVTRILVMLRVMATGKATTNDMAAAAGLSVAQAKRLLKQARELGCKFDWENRGIGHVGRYILNDPGPFRL